MGACPFLKEDREGVDWGREVGEVSKREEERETAIGM